MRLPELVMRIPDLCRTHMLGHALAHLAHVVDAARFYGPLDPRRVDRLDLVGYTGQRCNRVAVKILVADVNKWAKVVKVSGARLD